MKILVYKNRLQESPELFLRKAGYSFIPERDNSERSFARRLSRDLYPRFHVYYKEGYDKEGKEMVMFNLHLDQKRPGYAGYNRHNAEYDGELVEREAERIKNLFLPDFFQ